MNRILLLLSLPLLVLFLSGFAAPPPNIKHTIPRGIVGVRFVTNEEIKPTEITYSQAAELMKQADLKWFFQEFDRDYLIFFSAKYVPNPIKNKRPWGTYETKKIYQIKRSQEAAESLGVSSLIEFYEKGKNGVRGGVSEGEVVKVLGQPDRIDQLGPFGSFDYVYEGFSIRFLDYKVAGYDKTN